MHHISQRYSLGKHAITYPCLQSSLSGNINLAVEQFLKFDHQCGVIQECPARFEIDQHVYVAVMSGLVTRNRSKDYERSTRRDAQRFPESRLASY